MARMFCPKVKSFSSAPTLGAGRKVKGESTYFLKLLAYGLEWDSLERVFIDLDVSKVKASVKHDLDAIMVDFSADVGVQKMTHQLNLLTALSPQSLLMTRSIHGMKNLD